MVLQYGMIGLRSFVEDVVFKLVKYGIGRSMQVMEMMRKRWVGQISRVLTKTTTFEPGRRK